MKSIKYGLLLFALTVLLTACAGNNTAGNTPVDESPEIASPEVIDDSTFYINISAVSSDKSSLEFVIVNTSGEDAKITMVPTLELKGKDGSWEVIPSDRTESLRNLPDSLPTDGRYWAVNLNALWGNLNNGEYRLSYLVTDAAGLLHIAYGEFTLSNDLVLIKR